LVAALRRIEEPELTLPGYYVQSESSRFETVNEFLR